MFQLVDEQIGRIGDENRQFLGYLVDDFYQFKKMSKGGVKWTRIGEEEKRRLENRVYLMLEYVVGPVLAYYGHKCNRAVYQVHFSLYHSPSCANGCSSSPTATPPTTTN